MELNEDKSPAYSNYWKKKQLRDTGLPLFPVVRWYPGEGLSPIEQIYFDKIKHAKNVLDVGAGDLRVRKKFLAAGYSGQYDSLDFAAEYTHTFNNWESVNKKYDAILCLDVIEHLTLYDGLALLEKIKLHLNSAGVIILQTPNARCIRNPLSLDMTHLHAYNLPDLWTYFAVDGFQVDGYRITVSEGRGMLARLSNLVSKIITTRFLGVDYADNIAIVVQTRE